MRVLALVFALVFAGCAAPGGPDVVPSPDVPVGVEWAKRALPSGERHNHVSVADHANLTTPNFQIVGWDPLVTDALGATAGGHFCGASGVTAEGRKIAVVHSFDPSTDVAFVLVDVTDHAAPKKLGEYLLDAVHVYDVTISPDGRYVAVGTNPTIPDFPLGFQTIQPRFRDACGVERAVGPEQAVPLAPGVVLVDVSDPESPQFRDFAPTPALGPHSMHAAEIDGATVFLASITNLEHQASYFQFYGIQELPVVGAKLALLSTYQGPPGPSSDVPLINGHVDGYIAEHPGTGQTIAWLANWDGGVIVLDVSMPRVPVELARWGGTDAPGGIGGSGEMDSIHGTFPLGELWGDKHYTLAGQEIVNHPEDRPTGYVFILDTTDPSAPTEVARWTLPVDVEWNSALQFSTHYFIVVGKTLFVSMYHGGVWAIDLADPAAPKTVGVWIPDRVSPSPPSGEFQDEVLDVMSLGANDLLSFGSISGAYVLRFDPTRPMTAPAPWAG